MIAPVPPRVSYPRRGLMLLITQILKRGENLFYSEPFGTGSKNPYTNPFLIDIGSGLHRWCGGCFVSRWIGFSLPVHGTFFRAFAANCIKSAFVTLLFK